MSIKSINPDQGMTIIDGSQSSSARDPQAKKLSNQLRKKAESLGTFLYGRKRSAIKVRNFKSDLIGLRNDTEYVIKISFVLSGRKLGSESYRILCADGACRKKSDNSSRKSSSQTTSSGFSSTNSTPKSSFGSLPGTNTIFRGLSIFPFLMI